MTRLSLFACALGSFFLAAWLTRVVLRYAAGHLLDVPNDRSSHAVATPRGGGIAIVLAMLAGILLTAANGWLVWEHALAIIGGGALVAAIGFADDHRPMPRRWRLLGHCAAAVWVLAWQGGFPAIPLLGASVDVGVIGDLFGLLYIIWLINLANFMDGIDGIAGTETVTVAASGAAIFAFVMRGDPQWVAPLLLAAATAGFLVWNWPPARIFMGDAGSGFVGFALATLSLQATAVAPSLFWSWVILLAVFVVDATVTLVRRALAGHRVYEAHRTHAYQHAAARWGSHAPVTVAVGAINLVWLLPMAFLAGIQAIEGPHAVLIAYTPLVAAAIWLRAGVHHPGRTRAGGRYV